MTGTTPGDVFPEPSDAVSRRSLLARPATTLTAIAATCCQLQQGRCGLDVVWIGGETSIGGVWRATYTAPERQVGQRCWLRRDCAWHCESE